MNCQAFSTKAPRGKLSSILTDVTLPGGICIKGVRCHEFSGDPVVDMLVGMDIICMGDFAITNAQGVTLMSYRLPPASRHTDYTQPTS